MNAVRAITANAFRRLVRDRTALFFMLVLPVMVITVVGLTVTGDSRFRVGLAVEGNGPVTDRIVTALSNDRTITVRRTSAAAAATSVRRSQLDAAVILPAGLDDAVLAGGTAQVEVLAETASAMQRTAQAAVESAISVQAARFSAARFAATKTDSAFGSTLEAADATAATLPAVTVKVQVVDARRTTLPGGFDYSAPTMLVLFVFINAMAAGGAIVESRRLGIYGRMGATPTGVWSIVAGETASYLVIALTQALLIIAVGALAFGVSWGDPLAATVLVVLWALVGTAAGVLTGTLARTASQASAIGPAVGMALGMLGGCMWPLSIVGPTMRAVGHAVPHAWAVDAWTALLSRNASIGDLGAQLGVLALFAAGLLCLAALRLRTALATAASA